MRIPGLQLDVDSDRVPWRTTDAPGVRWLLLASEAGAEAGDAKASSARSGAGTRSGAGSGATVLIRMEPGHGYPAHRHLGVEEVLVLAGGYRDGQGEYRSGDFVRYEPQSVHAPVALGDPARGAGADNPACVLFATARGGIAILERES